MTMILNIAHATAIGGGSLLFYLSQPGSSLFSYHPAMMSAGLLIFIMESLLLFADKRVPKKKKVTLHWFFACLAVLCVLLGFQAIYRVKTAHGKSHFTTWHGLFGVITVAALSLQIMGGVPTLYSREAMKFTGIHKKKIVEAHGFLSLTCGILMIVTLLTGYYTTWFVANVPGVMWWVIVILTVVPRVIFGNAMKAAQEKKEKNRQKNENKKK